MRQSSEFNSGRRHFAGACFVLANATALIAAGELADLSSNSYPAMRFLRYLGIGIIFGCLLGQAVSLCLWSAWGRRSHVARLLLLLAAEVVAVIASSILAWTTSVKSASMFVLIIGLLMLIIFPIAWLARLGMGLRMIHRLHDPIVSDPGLQFGIMHLMVVTLAISILLTLGRFALRFPSFAAGTRDVELSAFLFLAVAAILISIPPFLAMLADRQILWMLPMAIVSTLLIGAVEQPIWVRLQSSPGPDFYHFLAINLATLGNVLIFATGLRLFGNRLTIGR